MTIELPKSSPFDEDKIIRVIGIDPGTNSLGIGVLERDLESNKIALIWANTVKSSSFKKEYQTTMELNGERFAKIYGYKRTLIDFFNRWEPNVIICEGNYMGHYPIAYAALSEMVLIIRLAALEYRSDMAVKIIDPSSVKKHIGVKGDSGDKELTRERVKRLKIDFCQPQTIDKLDADSIDAIAVGYWGISH